jgi:hypothetical protein
LPSAIAYWTFIRPDHAERLRHHPRDLADLLQVALADLVGGQHAARVAAVDAGLLDVLHDAADHALLAVGQRVDVDLERVLQELVHQDRALGALSSAWVM